MPLNPVNKKWHLVGLALCVVAIWMCALFVYSILRFKETFGPDTFYSGPNTNYARVKLRDWWYSEETVPQGGAAVSQQLPHGITEVEYFEYASFTSDAADQHFRFRVASFSDIELRIKDMNLKYGLTSISATNPEWWYKDTSFHGQFESYFSGRNEGSWTTCITMDRDNHEVYLRVRSLNL